MLALNQELIWMIFSGINEFAVLALILDCFLTKLLEVNCFLADNYQFLCFYCKKLRLKECILLRKRLAIIEKIIEHTKS